MGFRWFAREKARQLALRGWVSNQSDGSVELAACGPAEQLAALRQAIGTGPPGAQVTELVDLAPVKEGDLPQGFSIQS